MKKRLIVILVGLFLLAPFASAKVFTWTLSSVNHRTISAKIFENSGLISEAPPVFKADLGKEMNVSDVWAFGWTTRHRYGTSFILEYWLGNKKVGVARCLPEQGCKRLGRPASERRIATGCVGYCKYGCWVGPEKPLPNSTVRADNLRARQCYTRYWPRLVGTGFGGVSKFKYEEVVDSTSGIKNIRIDDKEVNLGLIKNLVSTKNATKVKITTRTPGILVWLGNKGDKKTRIKNTFSGSAWACVDTDNNNQCDYEQAKDCLAKKGDWYKGKCCGVDYTTCQYVPEVNALCGKPTPTTWEWAPIDDPGTVHKLLSCPGGSVMSDGKSFFSCGEQFNTVTKPFGEFKKVKIDGFEHEFQCFNKIITECQGSDAFSFSENSRFVGAKTENLPALSCPSGLVAYWPLDGNAKDAFGIAEGTIQEAQSVPGVVGKALSFDGINDRVEIPNTESLNVVNELTIEARIYPTVLEGKHTIVNKGNSYELVIQNGLLKAAIQRENGKWALEGTNTQLEAEKWQHVALAYDGNKMKLFINGIKRFEKNLPGQVKTSDLDMFLGDKADAPSLPDSPFSGIIDEVILYNKALTEAQVNERARTKQNPCKELERPPTYYCASDGDWTKDLDVKDEQSCVAAGFDWTGTLCCSEADDPEEYYNDPEKQLNLAELVIDSRKAEIKQDKIVLDANGSYVTLKGLVKITVNTSSQREPYAGQLELCDLLSTTQQTIPEGQTKTFVISEPRLETPKCPLRQAVIKLTPTTPKGGCWNSRLILSGQFVTPKIINVNGTFYGCKITSAQTLELKDSHTQKILVQNKNPDCESVMLNARPGAKPHATCSPDGTWQFTDKVGGRIEKQTLWQPPAGLSKTGCCAENQCWNGTNCVSVGSFYKIGDKGFVCK